MADKVVPYTYTDGCENTAFFRFPGIPGILGLIPGNFPIPGNSKNPGNTASLVWSKEQSEEQRVHRDPKHFQKVRDSTGVAKYDIQFLPIQIKKQIHTQIQIQSGVNPTIW